MNVLSLCNGMSGGEIALREAGVSYNKYYYSEIDKWCNQQASLNFPDSIPLGDIRNVDVGQLDPIDLVIAGTPCKNLSFAGSREGLICNSLEEYLDIRRKWLITGDEKLYIHKGKFQQSMLFWDFVRILRDIQVYNPGVKFLLENVRMKKDQQEIIDRELGVKPVVIDSQLVSAQRRYRLYWTNIRTRQEDLFGSVYSDIPQPKDRKIFLKDILEPEEDIAENFYIKSNKYNFEGLDVFKKARTVRMGGGSTKTDKHNWDIVRVPDKSYCLDSNYFKGASPSVISKDKCKRQVVFAKTDRKGNLKKHQDKASCLGVGGKSGGNNSDMDVLCVAMRGRNPYNPSDRRAGIPLEQTLEPNATGKTNTLTNASKDNLIANKGYRLRRLTPKECCRLQTVPEWYKWNVSNTQQYKMLGNGFTIEIIKHILCFLK